MQNKKIRKKTLNISVPLPITIPRAAATDIPTSAPQFKIKNSDLLRRYFLALLQSLRPCFFAWLQIFPFPNQNKKTNIFIYIQINIELFSSFFNSGIELAIKEGTATINVLAATNRSHR